MRQTQLINTMLPSVTSSISIIFLVLTFLVGRYEQNRSSLDDDAAATYKRYIRIMRAALLIAFLSFLAMLGFKFNLLQSVTFWSSLGLFVLELLVIVGGMYLLTRQVLEG